MSQGTLFLIYQIILPIFLLVAAPGFLIKMRKRGGWKVSVWERFGRYSDRLNSTDLMIQAVSVGEGLIAMKVIEELRRADPDLTVTLAVGTATGRQMAELRAPSGVQVIYAPLDLPWMVSRCLAVIEPKAIAFIEGECWPNFTRQAAARGIPMSLLSARLSPGSASRYERFPAAANLLFGRLSFIGVPDDSSLAWWSLLKLNRPEFEVTGNIKFDPTEDSAPRRREKFEAILKPLFRGQKILIAVSTHPGEEVLIAEAARGLGLFPVLVPRHAERSAQVKSQLEALGWTVVRRSRVVGVCERSSSPHCLLIDSTGELRDWTAHADLAVVGKSFLAKGGQSPVEAILAGIPVITGPEMGNFKNLMKELVAAKGVTVVEGEALRAEFESFLDGDAQWGEQVLAARSVLERHRGATARSAERLKASLGS